MKTVAFWFRRDLRLADNTALNKALASGNKVLPIFIFDMNILAELDHQDARFSFIYKQLKEINETLAKHGSSVHCYLGDPLSCWKKICGSFQLDSVYINKDYEPYAIKRDQTISNFLESKGIAVVFCKDQVIFEEHEVMKPDGSPYTVFTPYKNKWLEHFRRLTFQDASPIDYSSFYKVEKAFPTIESLGFELSPIKVKDFTLDHVKEYGQIRDYPFLDKTSYLSVHLRFGSISIRDIIRQLAFKESPFLNELIWREFFMQILFHFPEVIDRNFKAKYDGISWNNDENDFEKWCVGKTGYPMVDAGMRQLNETGYMHNRVRMITAGFLCKHLLIDWRWGEAYFAKKLLDYELSSNNGNWQWAAGTGCDAAPYFRIFNPMEQAKKFDKEENYIRKWIPEYGTSAYPSPMVEHSFARNRALERYKEGILTP